MKTVISQLLVVLALMLVFSMPAVAQEADVPNNAAVENLKSMLVDHQDVRVQKNADMSRMNKTVTSAIEQIIQNSVNAYDQTLKNLVALNNRVNNNGVIMDNILFARGLRTQAMNLPPEMATSGESTQRIFNEPSVSAMNSALAAAVTQAIQNPVVIKAIADRLADMEKGE